MLHPVRLTSRQIQLSKKPTCFPNTMAAATRIIELSTLIAQQTAVIDEFLAENKLPTPSLDTDAPALLPIPDDAVDIKAAREAVVEACSELKDLLKGPRELIRFNVSPVLYIDIRDESELIMLRSSGQPTSASKPSSALSWINLLQSEIPLLSTSCLSSQA